MIISVTGDIPVIVSRQLTVPVKKVPFREPREFPHMFFALFPMVKMTEGVMERLRHAEMGN